MNSAVRLARRLALVGVAIALFAPAAPAQDWSDGDVFVGVGNGQVKRYDNDGNYIETLNNGAGSFYMTGMAFDSDGNLYVTTFSDNNVTKFDNTGAVAAHPYVSGINANPESIVFDGSGNMYVGVADGNADIYKYSSTGTLLGTFNAATGPRGTDWVEMAADGCTIYYTSEGAAVKRYDVCTSTQLTDFAALPSGTNAYALRLRSNGDLLVAATGTVYRLDNTGSIVQSYTPSGAQVLFALNLDPDGTSFWTADLFTGVVYKIDISTGSTLLSFNSSPATYAAGLAIYNEPLVVCTPPSISDQPDDATVCPGESVTFTVVAAGTGTLGYQWQKDGVDIPGANSDSYTISSVAAGDAGDYTVVVSGDCDPDATSDAATLTVSPNPTFTVSADPNYLWPPNGSMNDIHVTIDVDGVCAPSSIVLESITSDETNTGIYDNADFGTSPADVDFRLKARRDGGGDGRVYTITYRMYYPIGGGQTGSSTASTTVTVPHDQGN